MQTIRLERGEWTFDEAAPLGPPGGFGEVFGGNGNGVDVAVKRLKLSAGAASHRELKIGADLSSQVHNHVVPILDYGQDAESDRYFLIMPICDFSLQEKINSDGPLTLAEAKSAAQDIVSGLIEVKHIVHRDLKPGNVLWHEGQWKIADFGIAKFVEDATSLESLRTSLTAAYAAPEQWRGERPTNATDVYALGCVIYAMLAGRPPFVGSGDDIREAHLHTPAPTLPGADTRLAGLVATMLRKAEGSRPSLERSSNVISSVQVAAPSGARAALAAAGHAVSQEEAAVEAERSAREAAKKARLELVNEANTELTAIVKRLFDAIESETDSARRERSAITLGPARLLFEVPRSAFGEPPAPEGGDPYGTKWDIATNAYLTLVADRGQRSSYDPGTYKFSVSLVFAKTPGDAEYRWREISFHEVFSQRSNFDQPFSLNPFERDFQVAVSNVMGKHQIAHGPLTIDGEDEDSFHERWLKLFAKAAARQLHPPQGLPLSDAFFQ
jgi:serine/threonine protein kinase